MSARPGCGVGVRVVAGAVADRTAATSAPSRVAAICRFMPGHVPVAFEERYAFGSGPHPHVHGANLGIRASAYLAAGGFRPLRTAEDHALLATAAQAGRSVVQAGDVAVETSGRRLARAPLGFSHLLRTLADRQASAPPTAMRPDPIR